MDSKTIAPDLAALIINAENIVAKIKSGEGFNLTEEQKKEFEKAYNESNAPAMVEKAKQSIEKLKDVLKKES